MLHKLNWLNEGNALFLLAFLPLRLSKMNLVKMQIPLDERREFFLLVKVCVATIGVCIFRAFSCHCENALFI